jgi:hypothetical protein
MQRYSVEKEKAGCCGSNTQQASEHAATYRSKNVQKSVKKMTRQQSGLAIPETSLDKDRFLLSSHGST